MKKKSMIWLAIVLTAVAALALLFVFGVFKKPPYKDYKDGEYIGEAEGYRKHLKVKVKLDGGYIISAEVIEHYEKGAEYYEVPIRQIPDEIMEKQSTDVDVVSGATLTSNGIIDAAKAALAQAQ